MTEATDAEGSGSGPDPAELIARSRRLGADRRNTNYAGVASAFLL